LGAGLKFPRDLFFFPWPWAGELYYPPIPCGEFFLLNGCGRFNVGSLGANFQSKGNKFRGFILICSFAC
jgi:hypothetical protein